ncbi:MAG TPA: hypothetical protein VHE33_12620 [Acidobacteriaceae bacterium]|nr:hypothetical protein [Acidobacteriaceae bacterium]
MDSVDLKSRRRFLKGVLALPAAGTLSRFSLWPSTNDRSGRLPAQTPQAEPGRIENAYVKFLPGERESLEQTPRLIAVHSDAVVADFNGTQRLVAVGASNEGWLLAAIIPWLNGTPTAVLEKHVTHRGVLVYLTTDGEIARIPKFVGDLSQIRPRPIQPPSGVKFERPARYVPGPDVLGNAVLQSDRDPEYENVAALGEEFIGWTLVANEECGPERSLWLEADGRSREFGTDAQSLWAPDMTGRYFDPQRLLPSGYLYDYVHGYSKRTMLGGFLPAADIGVWNPEYETGYEVMMVLPPGGDARPIARVRAMVPEADGDRLIPDGDSGAPQKSQAGESVDRYWNGSAADFFTAAVSAWNRWHHFFDDRMQVEIPDEWLLQAARGGIALSRSSYRGLQPTYQIGEGAYTKIPERSHALFPVAHYEFVWAHQLWNLTAEVEPCFQFYLDHYILPNGNFLYNTQDQVEAPLNAGVFLENSARAWDYARDLDALRARMPILRRMAEHVRGRIAYSKSHFPASDPRHGLVWGSPEADLGDPRDDYPESHPFYYQNAAWTWRGFREHARALASAAAAHSDPALLEESRIYAAWATDLRADVESSLSKVLALRNPKMKQAGITPFTPFDTHRKPTDLSSYENHRFMEDWWMSDWGDPELDLGHFRHREIAGLQILGMNTDGAYPRTSNFMSHGTLAGRIRQEDYRPFLLALYALCCYTMDSGSRYSPEDAMLPGGYPGDGSPYGWSAVVNSELQAALGLRWLLCYEEHDQDVVHLQKAAPKSWFLPGERIQVTNCPTRFGTVSWTTTTRNGGGWKMNLALPQPFAADLHVHIHPPDGRPLRSASLGTVEKACVVLPAGLIANRTNLEIEIS